MRSDSDIQLRSAYDFSGMEASFYPNHLESSKRGIDYDNPIQSKGFNLVANVTDPSKDFDPPINSWQLNGLHVGAGLGDGALTATDGRLFYQNGTAEETRYNQAHTLSDGGTPPFPWGIAVDATPDAEGVLHGISINAGSGQAGIQLAQFPEHYPILRTPRHRGPTWPATKRHVPENCVAITLVPQCAELNELQEGSMSSHEFANTVNCYADVASIKWSEYGP
ncbi:hypothetical protein PG993_003786 [Apiospora rasikravindrae]|uniref:DUF7907 domain-containing protein n=1 Tax=Apiospora rasikravindrae TaxID=990691 RepID=A0ABR1U2Q4_9PEZI